MKRMTQACRAGVASFWLLMACGESDLWIGEIPSVGGRPFGTSSGEGGDATGTSFGGASGSAGKPSSQSPTPNSVVFLQTGDRVSPVEPLIAATDTGVLLAGFSADPLTVGLQSFAPGIESEAFVAHLTVDGIAWSMPLSEIGAPRTIVRTPDGDFLTTASYLPQAAQATHVEVSTAAMLYRVTSGGAIAAETRLDFDVETLVGSLAVSADGSVFFGGGAVVVDPVSTFMKRPIVGKCDPEGNKLWEQAPFGDFYSVSSVGATAILPNDDLVVAANFMIEDQPVEELTTPQSTIARITGNGEFIWRIDAFGLVSITALLALEDGDFLAAGMSPSNFIIDDEAIEIENGEAATGDEVDSTIFLARFDGEGTLRWITLAPGSFWPFSIAVDDRETAFVAVLPDESPGSEHIYLRSFSLSDGAPIQVYKTTGSEYTWATSVVWENDRLWVSGGFLGRAQFGTDLVHDGPSGAFVARFEFMP